MRPLWIIDLTADPTQSKSFFDNFWSANKIAQDKPDLKPWFHFSSYSDLGLPSIDETKSSDDIKQCFDKIIEDTAKILLLDVSGKDKRIKYPYEDNVIPEVLDIVFLGDLECEYTTAYFHTLSAYLRKYNEKWKSTNRDCRYFGMLWMPDNVNVEGNFKSEHKVFFHQLYNLTQSGGYNNRPFHSVFVFQSNIKEKQEFYQNMSLAVLHLSASKGVLESRSGGKSLETEDVFKDTRLDDLGVFVSAGCAGLFFEHSVQTQQEAFVLGHSILDTFINSESKVFVDKDAAIRYTNELPDFTSGLFETNSVTEALRKDVVQPKKLDFFKDAPSHSNLLQLKNIWTDYYNRFLVNLKKDVVNGVKAELLFAFENLKEKVVENQFEWLKARIKNLEDGIFNVIQQEQPQPQCSLNQMEAVAFQCKEKIEDYNKGSKNSTDIFFLDENLKKSLVTAKDIYKKKNNSKEDSKEIEDEEILKDLETQISGHPVVYLSMLVRTILIAVCMFFLFYPVIKFFGGGETPLINLKFLTDNPTLAALLGSFIPFMVFFWKSSQYFNKLKSLVDQYQAVFIHNINLHAIAFLEKAVDQSYENAINYCSEFIIEKRINEQLRQGLSVIVPQRFSFEETPYFQPLLISNIDIQEDAKLYAPGKQKLDETHEHKNDGQMMRSGTFDKVPILKSMPDLMVNLKRGKVKITELSDDDKQELLHELMRESVDITSGIQEELDPVKMTQHCPIALLLDVSGSMSGQPISDLKKAVADLKQQNSNLRWVAFSSNAVLDEEVNYIIPDASGGTDLNAGIDKVIESQKAGKLVFDKLVMVSDGQPSDPQGCLNKAKLLGRPVDVIFIGNQGSPGEDFMKLMASETGGVQQTISSASQMNVVVQAQMNISYKVVDGQKGVTFDKLIKMGHIEACALALKHFSERKMVVAEFGIERMLSQLHDKKGMDSFFQKAVPSGSVKNTVSPEQTHTLLKSSDVVSGKSQNDLSNTIINNGFTINQLNRYPNQPDLLLSLLQIRPYRGMLRDIDISYKLGDVEHQIKNNDNDPDPVYDVFLSLIDKEWGISNLYDIKIK
jgi:hypothetical protein